MFASFTYGHLVMWAKRGFSFLSRAMVNYLYSEKSLITQHDKIVGLLGYFYNIK